MKWTETRSEDMVVARARPRLRDDGQARHEAATARSPASMPRSSPTAGAYPAIGAFLPLLTQMMSVGVYDDPEGAVQRHARSLTNTTPIGAYRGAGRPEATQLIERVLDVAADELGIDPAEIRRKNFLAARGVPAHDAHRRELRHRRVREGARRRARGVRLRRAARRAGAAPRRAATRSSSASACRRTSRSPRRSAFTSSTARSRSNDDGTATRVRRHQRRTARATRPRSR